MAGVRKPILFIFTVIFGALLTVGIISEIYHKKTVAELPEDVRLKAKPDDIILYRELSALTKNGEPVIKYIYVKNKETPSGLYRGYAEDLAKRTSNAQIFLISKNDQEEKYVGKFYSGPRFIKKDGKWYDLATGTSTKRAFLRQIRPTLLSSVMKTVTRPVFAQTFSAGAGDGIVSVDDKASWAAATSSSSGVKSDDTVSINIRTNAEIDGQFELDRFFVPIDTSAISADSTIVSASFNMYVSNVVAEDDAYSYLRLVQTSQDSSLVLANEDFDQCGGANPTAGADDKLSSGLQSSDFNSFNLNATGLSWIKKNGEPPNCGTNDGYTCLGLREGHDVEGNEPSGQFNSIVISTSENTDEPSETPYLEVVYTTPPVPLNINSGRVQINSGRLQVQSTE